VPKLATQKTIHSNASQSWLIMWLIRRGQPRKVIKQTRHS